MIIDIWWSNHLLRDLSVMQSLFTGQFKSVMTCTCGYTSARFEPFNFLTVPLPEDTCRSILIHVVPLLSFHAIQCVVKVPKDSDVGTLMKAVRALKDPLEGINTSSLFLALEVLQLPRTRTRRAKSAMKIVALFNAGKSVNTLSDADGVYLFEVSRKHPSQRSPKIHINKCESNDSDKSDVKDNSKNEAAERSVSPQSRNREKEGRGDKEEKVEGKEEEKGMFICKYMYVYIYMCINMHMYMCVYIYVYLYVYVHVYSYICKYMYIYIYRG
jgi:hypothetical protein